MVLAPALKNGNCNISCHLLFCDAALNSADDYARSHQHCSLAVSNVYKCLHSMNPGQSGLSASSSFVFKWQWCACSVTTYLLFWHPSTSVRNATWKQMIYCSLSLFHVMWNAEHISNGCIMLYSFDLFIFPPYSSLTEMCVVLLIVFQRYCHLDSV